LQHPVNSLIFRYSVYKIASSDVICYGYLFTGVYVQIGERLVYLMELEYNEYVQVLLLFCA